MGRENFLSVKLNQLRLQLSLAVKLLLQSLCLKLANSLSFPLTSCLLPLASYLLPLASCLLNSSSLTLFPCISQQTNTKKLQIQMS